MGQGLRQPRAHAPGGFAIAVGAFIICCFVVPLWLLRGNRGESNYFYWTGGSVSGDSSSSGGGGGCDSGGGDGGGGRDGGGSSC